MEKELVDRFMEAALKNKSSIKELKNCALKAQQYEFAAQVRDIEKNNFPETKEQKEAKELANKFSTLFNMISIQAEPDAVYKIITALKVFGKKRGKFDLEDASKIITDAQNYLQ